MTSSGASFTIPVVPEPVNTDADSYYWSTAVKDAANQLAVALADHDDAIALLQPAYAGLYVDDNEVEITGIDTSPSQLSVASATVGPQYRMVSNLTTSTLDVQIPGVYQVGFNFSFSGTPSTEFDMHIYKNAVKTGIGIHRVIGTGGDVGAASCSAHIECDSGDTLSVYISADGASKAITPVDGQFNATLIHHKE